MPKILVVDDQQIMREALKAILVHGGHTVAEAQDGQVAQKLILSNEFDLVISDIQMPNFDGIELLKWIKANKPMPVILVTGFSEILETKQAFDAGADDFLTKPFRSKGILDSIRRLLAPKESPPTEGTEPIEHDNTLSQFLKHLYACE